MNPLIKYPVFVPEQVLTADSLNTVVEYLNEQNLSTRRNLIGIGIVCGLDVSSDLKKYVKISCGSGVTSLGLLINIPEQNTLYYRKFKDMAKPPYEKFIDKNDKQYKLWELLTEKEYKEADDPVNDKKLEDTSEFKLKNLAVLLYLEKIDKDLDNCIDEGCDEKGILRLFNLRKLLIKKTDLVKIIGNDKIFNTAERVAAVREQEIFEELHPACALPEVVTHRLNYNLSDLTSLGLSNINSWAKLKKAFLDVVQTDIVKIGEALYKSYNLYKDELIKLYSGGNPFSGYEESSIGSNDLYALIQTEVNKNDINVQYAYDFLCDLVKAYNEFSETATFYQSKCCINTDQFPYHLMLGALATSGKRSNQIYRHHWQPSLAVSNMNNSLEKLRLLHYKIFMMIENFKLRNFNSLSDIFITPGKYSGWPFSEHSMGHFYNDGTPSTIQKFWSYERTKRCKENTVLSYFSKQYSSRPFVLNPLLYSLQDYEYFRIEGHIGQEYETVLDNLKEKIKDFNLPFDVFGIKLFNDQLPIDIEDHCFNDIQTVYKSNRDEFLACLKFVDNQITAYVNAINLLLKKNPGLLDRQMPKVTSQFPFIRNIKHIYLILIIYAFHLKKIQHDLPEHIKDFNFQKFRVSYFVVSSFTLIWQIILEFIGNAVESMFIPFAAVTLLKSMFSRLTDDCMEAKFKSLYEMYRERLGKLQLGRLFPGYVDGSPGMEHIAGVKEGGTFILVYDEMPESEPVPEPNQPEEEGEDECLEDEETRIIYLNAIQYLYVVNREPVLLQSGDSLNPIVFINNNAESNDGNTNFAAAADNDVTAAERDNVHQKVIQVQKDYPTIQEFLEFLFGKFEPEQNVRKKYRVVADFAIPYRCCSSCLQVDEIPLKDVTIEMRPTDFCFRDTTPYPVTVTPRGGTLVSNCGGINQAGEDFTFTPAAVNCGEEDVILSYTIDGQTALLNVKVYHPIAKCHAVYTDDYSFFEIINDSENADTYQWKIDEVSGFASNEKNLVIYSEEFQNFDVIHVTLWVHREEMPNCLSDPYTQVLKIPKEPQIDVSIRLPKEIFCSNDPHTYPFELKPPEGGIITPEDQYTFDDHNKPIFKPAAATENEIEFTYTVDGNSDSCKAIVILIEAKIVLLEENHAEIKLKSESKGADSLQWLVNNVPRGDGEFLTFKKGEYPEGKAAVKLIAKNEHCSDEDEITFDWEQDIRFSLRLPKYNQEYIYCNNDQNLYLFETFPEGGVVEGDVGVEITSDGKYNFKPLNLHPGEYKFQYMGEELMVKVVTIEPISFSYDIGQFDERSQTIRVHFIYDQFQSGHEINWDFGDGTKMTSAKKDVPKTFDLKNQQKFLVRIFRTNEYNCNTEYRKEFDFSDYLNTNNNVYIDPGRFGTVNLALHSDNALHNRLSEYNFTASDNLLNYHNSLIKDISNESRRKSFLNGRLNVTIAKKYSPAINSTVNTILKAIQNNDDEMVKYLTNMYIGELQLLVSTIGALNKEPGNTSTLFKALTDNEKNISLLKENSIDINPDGNLKSLIDKSITQLRSKRNTLAFLKKINVLI
ncbi:hypothetical protein N9164_04300 [Draconibacterium sp.]|nr:hypothetical protein [Draconibacterium sp.]